MIESVINTLELINPRPVTLVGDPIVAELNLGTFGAYLNLPEYLEDNQSNKYYLKSDEYEAMIADDDEESDPDRYVLILYNTVYHKIFLLKVELTENECIYHQVQYYTQVVN